MHTFDPSNVARPRYWTVYDKVLPIVSETGKEPPDKTKRKVNKEVDPKKGVKGSNKTNHRKETKGMKPDPQKVPDTGPQNTAIQKKREIKQRWSTTNVEPLTKTIKKRDGKS